MDASIVILSFDTFVLALAVYLLICAVAPKLLAEAAMWLCFVYVFLAAPVILLSGNPADMYLFVDQILLWTIPTGVLGVRYHVEKGDRPHVLVQVRDLLSPVAGIEDTPNPRGGQRTNSNSDQQGTRDRMREVVQFIDQVSESRDTRGAQRGRQPQRQQPEGMQDYEVVPDSDVFDENIDIEGAVDDIDDFRR